MDHVDECFKCIQGKDTLLIEQVAYFDNVLTAITKLADISKPFDGVKLLTTVSKGEVLTSAVGVDGLTL